MESNKEDKPNWFIILATLTIIGVFLIYLIIPYFSPCISSWFDKDKYCAKIYDSNLTNSLYHYEIRSYIQDKINQDEQNRIRKEQIENTRKLEDCFNDGQWYNQSFDIIKDYGLNCDKLRYINDHLIDKSRQVDGGYIDGSYSGFLSYGHIEGHIYQYVTEGVLATGQLPKNISYHIDCQNSSLGLPHPDFNHWTYQSQPDQVRDETKLINYYTESEFVMYYVNRCIK